MRHRIYTPDAFTPGTRLAVRGEELHHAARVVRLREGEEVELFDGKGNAARGVVASLGRDELTVDVAAMIEPRESPLAITLAMSIIALDKFELVLQKATELGVHAIVPIVTERVEIRPERYRGKQERWEKIIFEAVKQCGRARTPKLEEVTPFAEAIARDGARILFDADEPPTPPATHHPRPTTLFIGPEGGFTQDEVALAARHGAHIRRMGPRRLRAETAAIVACVEMGAEYGDLR
jgi:16S rRNA (uracil1498-N3)-methyltransferase